MFIGGWAEGISLQIYSGLYLSLVGLGWNLSSILIYEITTASCCLHSFVLIFSETRIHRRRSISTLGSMPFGWFFRLPLPQPSGAVSNAELRYYFYWVCSKQRDIVLSLLGLTVDDSVRTSIHSRLGTLKSDFTSPKYQCLHRHLPRWCNNHHLRTVSNGGKHLPLPTCGIEVCTEVSLTWGFDASCVNTSAGYKVRLTPSLEYTPQLRSSVPFCYHSPLLF